MNSDPLKIIVFAGESAGVRLLRSLQKANVEVLAVVCDVPRGENVGMTPATFAENAGLMVWPATERKDAAFVEKLHQSRYDLLFCVRFPYILSAAVLDTPRRGAFNMHSGPLPQYAGLNVCSWAIYNGELHHSVTVHEMTAEIDAGPINYEKSFPIMSEETGASLTAKCVKQGVPLFRELLDAIAKGELPRKAQDLSERRYYGREVPNGGNLNWNQPAEVIHRFVRAASFYPYPSPWGYPITYGTAGKLAVVRTSRTDAASSGLPGCTYVGGDGSILVDCADEKLRVDTVLLGEDVADAASVIHAGESLTLEAES